MATAAFVVKGVVKGCVAPLRFGRCTSCVVKVFGEISDVIPSDAYQMLRYRGWISEITDLGQNRSKS